MRARIGDFFTPKSGHAQRQGASLFLWLLDPEGAVIVKGSDPRRGRHKLGARLILGANAEGARLVRPGDDGRSDGMIVTDGGRFGGYGLYVLKGKPVFTYNNLALEITRWEGREPLTPGKHSLEFDFKYDGPGMAKGGSGVLKVDGKEVATKSIAQTTPAILTIDETFDIGSDTRTPVDDAHYQASRARSTESASSSGRRNCCQRTTRPRNNVKVRARPARQAKRAYCWRYWCAQFRQARSTS